MHSSNADCVRGDARLSSSASTTFANTGPGRNANSPLRWSNTLTPVTSLGSTSGVSWMRANEQSSERARARASVVFPTPGTSSTSTWPSASSATTVRSTASASPLTASPMFAITRSAASRALSSPRGSASAASIAPIVVRVGAAARRGARPRRAAAPTLTTMGAMEAALAEPRGLESARDAALRVIANIGLAVSGEAEAVERTVVALLAEGHVLVEDVPGVGKTTLARALARSLDCSFARIQLTPDVLPSDVTGVSVFDQRSGEFAFRPGPVFANVVLADELNRASPRTQSALLECMQERQVTVDGATRALAAPFFLVATQNPIEQDGTFPLPEAQLDRFALRLALGYPEPGDEARMLADQTALE